MKKIDIIPLNEMHEAGLGTVTIRDREALLTIRNSDKANENGEIEFWGEHFNVMSPEILQNSGKRLNVTGGIRVGGMYIVGFMVREIPHPVGAFCTGRFEEPFFTEFVKGLYIKSNKEPKRYVK
jgi:hypothetical protein